MKTFRWIALVLGLLLVLLAVWQIRAAQDGLIVVEDLSANPPVTFMTKADGDTAPRPLVLVGHGFAASRVVMRGFGLTFAHAGYDVVLWDFTGHGANEQPMPVARTTTDLMADAEQAWALALDAGLGDSGEQSILGHSMGSGVALFFGQAYPQTGATIAVSPVGEGVTPELPRNLLLMAGELEGRFVANARQLLELTGGEGGDPEAGTARDLVIVPNVEHVSILFSPLAHHTARDWMDGAFGVQPGAVDYTDRRILWYGLAVLGTMLFLWGVAPLVNGSEEETVIETRELPLWRRVIALLGGALGASLLLWLLSLIGFGLRDLFGLLVGGYLLLWFGTAGLLALILLGRLEVRFSVRSLLAGLLITAGLWLGVGLLGQLVWQQWLLIPARLARWPIGLALLLPWFLAVAQASLPARGLGRAGWWLAHTLIVLGGVYLALRLNPELGFLFIILPLFPIILGLQALAAGPYRGRLAFTLSGAIFVSWLLLAVFPLQ